MPPSRQRAGLDPAEYLRGEQDGSLRHEYLDGEVYAMTGASRRHNVLTFNLSGLLHRDLQPPCQGYVADMRVRIRTAATEAFYYPDLAVDCRGGAGNDLYLETPVLIMEVISPSTERGDKHEKRLNYQQLDSLEEYLLVHQDFREVWVYRRAGQWRKEVYSEGRVALPSVGLTLDLDEVYRNTGL